MSLVLCGLLQACCGEVISLADVRRCGWIHAYTCPKFVIVSFLWAHMIHIPARSSHTCIQMPPSERFRERAVPASGL